MKNKEPQPPFQEEAFIEKWNEWIQYRKERKLAKYVPTGLKKTWTNLYSISGGSAAIACEIIDQSISQNWQGLFQLKSNGTNFGNPQQNVGAKPGTSAARVEALKNWGRNKAN